MSEEILDSAENGNGERPTFLTVICILSFIGAGLGILGYITAIGLLGAASSAGVMEGLEGMEGFEEFQSAAPSAGMTWAYIIVGFLATIVSLLGVIKMWNLKKEGFMWYTVASIAIIIMGFIYAGFSVVGVIVPAAFIAMYYVNLKHMK